MKKEKVYNEAVSGDEGFAPGDGYPSCDGEPCANVSDETDEATDTLADGEPAAEADAAKALEEAVAQWQDKYVRLQAEFDNYRKRTLKEKMDLDIDVSRLKLLKANHLSQRYSLEDQILKEFPQKIKSLEQRIEGYQTDIDQRKRNTEPNEDGFSPMFMPGGTVREKKAAGDAILGLCKSMTSPDLIPIGQYRGFDMELSFDTFSREYKITLIHQLRHTVTLGTDIFGNIQRLDNTLGAFEERMTACAEQLENTRVQLENAKAEVQKSFPQEEELKTKSARLNELNAMLNLDKRENEIVDGERADEEPSRSSDDRER